jgi:hypothetical protein
MKKFGFSEFLYEYFRKDENACFIKVLSRHFHRVINKKAPDEGAFRINVLRALFPWSHSPTPVLRLLRRLRPIRWALAHEQAQFSGLLKHS